MSASEARLEVLSATLESIQLTLNTPFSSLSTTTSTSVRFTSQYSNKYTPKGSAMCVQRFDDSQSSAIRITYRISLRSSSFQEPRYPSWIVIRVLKFQSLSLSSNSLRSARSRSPPQPSKHSQMILPQVHLRKPCYDFTFL